MTDIGSTSMTTISQFAQSSASASPPVSLATVASSSSLMSTVLIEEHDHRSSPHLASQMQHGQSSQSVDDIDSFVNRLPDAVRADGASLAVNGDPATNGDREVLKMQAQSKSGAPADKSTADPSIGLRTGPSLGISTHHRTGRSEDTDTAANTMSL
jgi:hypothetical protein